MTYDQLVAFVAVAASGAFTAASARLHKSQPAVSKLVRTLEDELGLVLFDRREYRATLTEAGRQFYERATAVIEETEALRSFGHVLAGDVEPRARIAIEAVTPLAPIMDLLRTMRDRHPTVRIELSTERLAGSIDALRSERADLAVATKIGTAGIRLEAARYQRVRIVPVASRDHPLAACGVPIPPSMLRAHAQIVLNDSALSDDSPSLNVLEGGLKWSVTDIAAKKEIIAAGMGWGGLPEHVVADELESGELVELQVPEFESEVMELFVLRRRDRAHGVVAQAIWEALCHAPVAGQSRRRSRTRRTK